ncbi:MAG: STM4013/SEN3800 family hydrolase [Hellea sp.]
MLNVKSILGQRDILFITFDTLRFDVAAGAMRNNQTPFLQSLLPKGEWEKRHSPASFTYAAHHAFFTGFLPTPAEPGPHERLFALDFPGSATTGERTLTFDAPDIISGFRKHNYQSLCIGGVGFFNKLTPLGCTLPAMFDESQWTPEFGVTDKNSADNQFTYAAQYLKRAAANQRVFMFINLSAMHQPNYHHLDGAVSDSTASQAAALGAVDAALAKHSKSFEDREWLCVFTSDHGTVYGEDKYQGHRLAHETVWTVPYAEFLWG